MSDQRRKVQGVPLPPLVAQLRESCEASARIHGGTSYHAEELGIFRAIAAEQDLFLSEALAELMKPPTAEGQGVAEFFRQICMGKGRLRLSGWGCWAEGFRPSLQLDPALVKE